MTKNEGAYKTTCLIIKGIEHLIQAI